MRSLMWFFTWVSIAVWSFVVWVAHGAFRLGTFALDAVTNTRVDGFTPEPFSLGWLLDHARDMGASASTLIWLAGAAVLYGAAKLTERAFFPKPTRRLAAPQDAPPQWRDASDRPRQWR